MSHLFIAKLIVKIIMSFSIFYTNLVINLLDNIHYIKLSATQYVIYLGIPKQMDGVIILMLLLLLITMMILHH